MTCSELTPLLSGGEDPKQVYYSINEAIANKFNSIPSPLELSEELGLAKELPKPIYIKVINDKYCIVGGSIRYWGWVIAFGMHSEIPCIILN
jgi:hypothetical protein